MSSLSVPELHAHLHRTGVVAVLILEDAHDAVPVARALLAGGVDCIELTLRTPSAMESLRRIVEEVPEMVVGAGTVLTAQQVHDVKAAGAAFAVSPGLNPRVVSEANKIGLPFAPGVCTPTDIELALEQGCRVLKFFPSEPCGGLTYLRTIAAPFAHLGVKYLPLGGVGPTNAADYLREPQVLALGGSWLGPQLAIRKQDWETITQVAADASKIVQQVRGAAA